MLYSRYAVFYCPRHTTEWARRGRHWLGWDIDLAIAVDTRIDDAVEQPERVGFHLELVPPFALEVGLKQTDLTKRLDFALQALPPLKPIQLTLKTLNQRVVLQPREPEEIQRLALYLRQELNELRKPTARATELSFTDQSDASFEELAASVKSEPLVPHFPLSKRLEPLPLAVAVERADLFFDSVFSTELPVREVCLVGERSDGYFVRIRRMPLG